MKKHLVKIVVLMFAVSLIAVSCKKRKKEEDPKPDGQALHETFMQNRRDMLQTFTIDASQGGTITGSEGTVINFPPNAFTLNGNPVSGNVEVELIELYGRDAMLLTGRPTNGVKPNGDVEIMKSGGSLYVNAKKGSDILEIILPYQITTRPLPSNDPNVMFVLDGGRGLEDTEDWTPMDENNDGHEDVVQPRDSAAGWNFIFNTQNLGWTNLDRWYSFTGPKTQLFVDVPDGYDDSNCEVYLLYAGEPTALARMDRYDTQQEMFTEHYGYIPIGIQVHLVMVTEIDGTLYASIKSNITIVNNHVESMPDPQPTTQQDLENALNALP